MGPYRGARKPELSQWVHAMMHGEMAARKRRSLAWDDLRIFLAIAQNRSLTRAAQSLALTQPTVGRRLAALESKVGAPLFERTALGLVASELGQRLLQEVARMDAAAEAVERRIAGKDGRLDGLLRVTSLEWFGAHVLAPIAARFARLHPALTIELAADARHYSLSKREADVAFRFVRFASLDVVQRRFGSFELALYAAPDYLASFGEPDFARGLAGHNLVTLHEGAAHVPDFRWLSDVAPAARLAVRSNSSEAMLRAAESGAGLVLLPRYVGDNAPRLVRLRTPTPPPSRPIWLGIHKDLQHVPRVRAFIEFAADSIERLALGPPSVP